MGGQGFPRGGRSPERGCGPYGLYSEPVEKAGQGGPLVEARAPHGAQGLPERKCRFSAQKQAAGAALPSIAAFFAASPSIATFLIAALPAHPVAPPCACPLVAIRCSRPSLKP